MTDDVPKDPNKPTDDSFHPDRATRLNTPPIKNEPEPRREMIGPYKILAKIGEGGMGAVYLAEEERPVRRKVAVKLIKAGMDSRAIIARFEAERQALALMDHPNISRILGTGTTDDGRPYFAMEYVKGIPLTDYCRKHKLPILDRLNLFKQICLAVQHAHQKAIIHRDLKPGNILVTDQHGNPVPKIIDFGLAKAIGGQRLTEQTFFTAQGMMMGTPEYMSPEQADPSALDIDTRTDVYSLGVILYRLLAGVLPIEIKDLRAEAQMAALEAVRKKVCDEEPQKPSTRIGSSPDLGSQVADLRRMDRSGLVRKLKGDLDWITMKALEKDRNRRYATASDLVADIDRHLNHEPVAAGPPSQGYVLKKFMRKNVGLVASLGVIFLALATGGVTATVFYLKSEEALQEKETALQGEREAREDADTRREEAEDERQRARDAEAGERDERQKADLARSVAEKQRDEILRLSDAHRLDQIRADADQLWPRHPDKLATMQTWLKEAQELAGNLKEHRAALKELRAKRTLLLESSDSDEVKGDTSDWRLDDAKLQWQHNLLTDLVTGLEAFVDPDVKIGLIADVKDRVRFAKKVRGETTERYGVEWEEAIASIANEKECPGYKGLQIKPLVGLVPIGRDPFSELWEFADIQTGVIPDRDDNRTLVLTEETGLVFVLIPGGKFWMGSQKSDKEKPNYDPQAESDEGPIHEITLDSFFLSKYEMTQGQWERFTEDNPSGHNSGGLVPKPGLHPVEQVSWEDCERELSCLGFLLPTEAQWEYTARAGSDTTWWCGSSTSSIGDRRAGNLFDSRSFKIESQTHSWGAPEEWKDDHIIHAPVGSYSANFFGLHDVIGNVWEWTRDGYELYSSSVREGDGARPLQGSRPRVNRGGCFLSPASRARSANRDSYTPEFRFVILGLRPSRVIDP